MQLVLLERVEKLGTIGDIVTVKAGFARNYLLPQGKALRANKANIARFELEREAIEQRNTEKRDQAEAAGKELDGEAFILIRQAGETGHLYGSVSARDIAEAVGDSINRSQVILNQPIKEVGLHDVRVNMHPEVFVTIVVNVARTTEEGERQALGENVISSANDKGRAADAEVAEEQAAAMFDPEADIELEGTTSDEAEGETPEAEAVETETVAETDEKS
ncbi:LSU ribosomal protein L9p [hydrothermal vent metagenome]|uniref:LSU ribosomal protein L9p n=1 Tax=hydrothermal vent metagenome TaxID=652676 RepID=A0A3B0SCN1_9ZZZZ